MNYRNVFYCLLITTMVACTILFVRTGELTKFLFVSHNGSLPDMLDLPASRSAGNYLGQQGKLEGLGSIYLARQWKGNDNNLYTWSAIYDERMLDGRPPAPHVVVMGLYKHYKPSYLTCKLWYATPTNSTHHDHELVNASEVSFKYENFVMHCPCNRTTQPAQVCLGDQCEWQIAVESPPKPAKKQKLAICLKEVYDVYGATVDPIQAHFIVEWIEMNKLLGIDHIIVYNVSMNEQVSKVFRHYAREGFVTVHIRPPAAFEVGYKPNRHLGLNDCMFRYMHSFEKFIIIDCDEFVRGYRQDTVWELLEDEAARWNSSVDRMIFTFLNQRYFVDDVNLTPGPLVTQYAVRHVKAESVHLRSKQIVDSSICSSVTPHRCRFYTDKKHSNQSVVLKPTEAVVFHYKSCEKSRIENKPRNCSKEFQNSNLDLTMTKYGDMLSHRVEKAIKSITL